MRGTLQEFFKNCRRELPSAAHALTSAAFRESYFQEEDFGSVSRRGIYRYAVDACQPNCCR